MTVPAAMIDALAQGSGTLCRCVRLARPDGVVLGFTDHDRRLSFDGLTFEAATAAARSELAERLGLAVATADLAGALSSEAITEADIEAGLYDGARLTVWRVDWSDPAVRAVEFEAVLGEVERAGLTYRAELRALTVALSERIGRTHQKLCDATLGDARCRVNLDLLDTVVYGTVVSASGTRITATGIDAGLEDDALAGGSFEWLTGALAGQTAAVVGNVQGGVEGETDVTLDAAPGAAPAEGDTFRVEAGAPRYKGTGTVTAVESGRRFSASGLDFSQDWFDRGRVTWLTGENAGRTGVVRGTRTTDVLTVDLWREAPREIAPGDTFEIVAGCDQTFATCVERFGNAVNHRGNPFQVGDASLLPPSLGGVNDGSSRFSFALVPVVV